MKRLGCAVGCLLALGACEFQRADEDPVQQLNSCSVASDCTGGAQCMTGLCVAPTSDAEFELALQVTPLPVAGTETPHPLLIENMKLDSSTIARRIDLPLPIKVSGQIRNGDATIDAALTFTPVRVLSGIASGTVAVSTRASGPDKPDYTVQLSSGAEYKLLVRPTDPTLPPWRTTFEASGAPVSLDYAELETFEQKYLLTELPKDRELLVQAFDVNNQPISSISKVEPLLTTVTDTSDGVATLVFAGEPAAYRLEIRAEQAYEPMRNTQPAQGIFCDDDTPVYPTYSIASSRLPEPTDGRIELKLPALPARVRFEGAIAVCEPGMMAIGTKRSPEVAELPVALSSAALLLEDESGFSASFEAQTTAQLDVPTQLLNFCVQLMEGHYDIVVTPPTNLPCGVYAENRLIEAPDKMAAIGAQLLLPKSAVLQGTLQTTDRTPIADVTIEAVALAREGEAPRAEDSADPLSVNTLLRYNRSRQVTTASDGKFSVPVDLGSYDVLVKPPAASGFAWQVRHDVGVGSERNFSSIVYMPSPVMLSGRLEYTGGDAEDQASLAGAEVLAFAVIGDEAIENGDVTSERAVPIGKAVAEPDGSFILLLPQTIKPDWEW